MTSDLDGPGAGRGPLLERLYEEALSLPEASQDAFLDEACANDPELRVELESLLAEGVGAESFLQDLGRFVEAPDPGPPEALVKALAHRYRIEGELGEGGMATVYLAADLRHDRRVAIKVLKSDFAAVLGADRFLKEIKTTANLQHPHILPLFDSGEADGFLFYVMPYVEGESLRDRLDRDHQLPVENALGLARKLADALDYAHRHGIIHRDIKPGNVLLHDGGPVIADFGIALAVESVDGGRLTEPGRSLGTPQYMSPEQATGDHHVGPVTDIYALGCVLYEALVGEPPFRGSTRQVVLGRVMREAPPSATQERASVPKHVDGAIQKALEKLPADRFQTAKDFAEALTDEGFRYGTTGEAPAPSGIDSRWRTAALAAFALAAVALLWSFAAGDGGSPTDRQVVRYSVPVDPSGEVRLGYAAFTVFGRPADRSVALSPDGTMLVYAGWSRNADDALESALYLRRLDQNGVTKLYGGSGQSPGGPFFSPDGQWLGFFEDGGIRRRSMVSGDVEVVVDGGVHERQGFGWSDQGQIFFIDREGRLMRVPEAGGEPVEVPVGSLEPSEQQVSHPSPVPGTSLVLFSVRSRRADGTHEVRAANFETGEHWVVVEDALDARVVDSGHLLFMRSGALMAVAFNSREGRAVGTPVTALNDVMHHLNTPNADADTGAGQYVVSRKGHLVYVPGGVYPVISYEVLRLRPDGGADTLPVEPRGYRRVRLSPDGRSLALSAIEDGHGAIYLYDVARGVARRLPTGGARSLTVFWSPDGAEVAYRSNRDRSFHRIAVDGGESTRLPLEQPDRVLEWAPNGDLLYFREGWQDLWALARSGEATQVLSLLTDIYMPTVSPDGRWLAYVTGETGRLEVYVRPYRNAGPPARISVAGGDAPAWSRDGRRLYFLKGWPDTPSLSAIDVIPGSTFEAGTPYTVVDPWPFYPFTFVRQYDVGPDGAFYGARGPTSRRDRFSVDELQIVLNFTADLEQRFSEQGGG